MCLYKLVCLGGLKVVTEDVYLLYKWLSQLRMFDLNVVN